MDSAAGKTALAGIEGVKSVELRSNGDLATYGVVGIEDRDLREAIYQTASEGGWILRELRQDVMDLEKIFHNLTQY